MRLLFFSVIVVFQITILAQDGILNSNFGNSGIVKTEIGTSPREATATAIQSDGKIVVAGYCDNSTDVDFAIARYNSDGTLDDSFDGDTGIGNGKITIVSANDQGINAMAIQPDGKIVVVGSTYNGSIYVIEVVRLMSDGKLDTGFGSSGFVTTQVESEDNEANAVIIQPDGKIVVAGFAATATQTKIAVVRYNTDGTLDTSFDTDGKVTTPVGSLGGIANSVDIQSDGKIVVAGYMVTETESYDFAVVRYNVDGSLDTSFDSDGIATIDFGEDGSMAFASAIQADNKILVAGTASVNDYLDFAVARLNSNGSLDTQFDTDGKVITDISTNNDDDDYAYAVALQSNGGIIVAGSSDDRSQFALVCYSGSSGPLPVELTSFIAVRIDEKVILKWSTATEVNNYGFEVQKRTHPFIPSREGKERSDMGVFETIGFVEGHGNSNSPKEYSFIDSDISVAERSRSYRLKQIDTDGKYEYCETITVELGVPTKYDIQQNHPNPFNPSTVINYSIPKSGKVTLRVYSILGEEVATLVNENKEAGEYVVHFTTEGSLASGIYLTRMDVSTRLNNLFSKTIKMILLR